MFYIVVGILALIAASGFARARSYNARCTNVLDADVVESRFILERGQHSKEWHTIIDSVSGQRATIGASLVFAETIATLMNNGASACCMRFIDRDLAEDMRNRQQIGKEYSNE